MDIYDKTADLASTIRESNEYNDYLEVKSEIEDNPDAKGILREYRTRQLALQMAEIAGENIDDFNDALAEICNEMEGDCLLSRYLEAEYNLTIMMQRIHDIFAEHLELNPQSNGMPVESGGFLN